MVWEYEYDDRGRLLGVDKDGLAYADYTYDGNGNRLTLTTTGGTKTAIYDGQDRISSYDGWVYTHGASGEVIQKTKGLDTWSYDYDALGNLLRVTLPGGTEVRYDYDAQGRPIARYVDGAYSTGWLWANKLEPVAEVDEEGNITARYVYGSRGHVPDYVVRGGTTYRIVSDFRGSVRAVLDVSDGSVVQENEYGPWGEVLSGSNQGFQSFGYAGGIWDAQTGLVLFGARWYDAEVGRWTSKEPLGFAGSMNFYGYVDGAPVNRIDPSGLAPGDPYPDITSLLPDLKEDIFWFGDGRQFEYGGYIYQAGTSFYYTRPRTDFDPNHVYIPPPDETGELSECAAYDSLISYHNHADNGSPHFTLDDEEYWYQNHGLSGFFVLFSDWVDWIDDVWWR